MINNLTSMLDALNILKKTFEGADQTEEIPSDVLEEIKQAPIDRWDRCLLDIQDDKNNKHQLLASEPTSKRELYSLAGILLAIVAPNSTVMRIADPYHGNGIGFDLFIQALKDCDKESLISNIRISDVTEMPNRRLISVNGFLFPLTLTNAASANINGINILVLFDGLPYSGGTFNPPNHSDTKLLMRWIKSSLKKIKSNPNLPFYLIMGGEIGAGSFTSGIFKWVNDHPNLFRICHRYLYKQNNSGFKGHREILMFRVVSLDKKRITDIQESSFDSLDRIHSILPPCIVDMGHVENIQSMYDAKGLNEQISLLQYN